MADLFSSVTTVITNLTTLMSTMSTTLLSNVIFQIIIGIIIFSIIFAKIFSIIKINKWSDNQEKIELYRQNYYKRYGKILSDYDVINKMKGR